MEISELTKLTTDALGQTYEIEISSLRGVITVLEKEGMPFCSRVVAFISNGERIHIGFNLNELTQEREAAIDRLARQYHTAGLRVTGVQVKPYGFFD